MNLMDVFGKWSKGVVNVLKCFNALNECNLKWNKLNHLWKIEWN